MPSEIGGGGKQMPLRCGPFRRPWWGVEVIHVAFPDAACPGLLWKPLDAAIGRLFLLRITSAAARATANKTTMYYVPTLMAISMAIPMRQNNTACIAQWRRFRAFIKATKHRHQASTRSDSINWTRQRRLFLQFHREKGLELTCWPLITIGVWNIKLMRST